MVSKRTLHQTLTGLKTALGDHWRANGAPVRRLLLLRNFFFDLHELVNTTLADPESPELPDELETLHVALATFPIHWGRQTQARIAEALATPDVSECIDWIWPPNDSETDHLARIPRHLQFPGREWEALIFGLALHLGWTALKTELVLETSESIQVWLETASRFSSTGPVTLALEKNPAGPHLWWVHQVAETAIESNP